MKIKTNYVPDNAKTYLTVGKEYELDHIGFIIDDEGDKIFPFIAKCHHLDNRAWEVCDGE